MMTEDFKQRLERLLIEREMKQTHIGDAIGRGQNTISNWIKGKSSPKKDDIKKLAKVLEVTPEYLEYGIEETQPVTNKVEEPLATYGLTKDELVEFFQWKAAKANEKAEEAQKQVERLKSTEVDAK